MPKKRKLKQQKIILTLLGIALFLSFGIFLKAVITGMAPQFGHSYKDIILPTEGETTPSTVAAAIWPSLNIEFLQGSGLADITGMTISSGIKCAWFFSNCPSGWLRFTSGNYKCSSTTYNPPGANCDNTFHAANVCCELT